MIKQKTDQNELLDELIDRIAKLKLTTFCNDLIAEGAYGAQKDIIKLIKNFKKEKNNG